MKKLANIYTIFSMILAGLLSPISLAMVQKIDVVTEYLEPYQTQNTDGSLGGFSTEVINALFLLTNDKANIQVMPWARAYEIGLHQPNTLIYSIARTSSREKKFHWIGALKEERLYFWGLKKDFPKSDYSVSELRDYRIAVSRNSNTAHYIINQQFNNIYQLSNERQNMKMLFIGRVDLILATEITIKTRSKNLSLEFNKLRKLTEVAALNNKLSIAFSLNTTQELIQKYQTAYQELIISGQLDHLKRKWALH